MECEEIAIMLVKEDNEKSGYCCVLFSTVNGLVLSICQTFYLFWRCLLFFFFFVAVVVVLI